MKRSIYPMRVLIVEDEALLAMDIEAIVQDCGHHVMAEAASLREVVNLPSEPSPNLAFVDIQLAEGSSGLDVSKLIQERWNDTVIIFVTANPKKIPDDFAGAHGVIPKPFSENGLVSAMHYIEEGVCDPPPTAPAPASFIASPNFAARWSG
ncbi:response regulator [Sphingomonas sp. LY160]|jgi:CheY-like chemotaxis protein|uniref:response regulator n=1 Tax=Sphingomonas sp. LY160 TaxID=3095342 RepID=UPI002ADEE6F9|nr:response regulator [Sphingomonas sp. LY160]MEA1072849.1 response regulator [Sphingomonas sp. LY160]